MKFKFMLLFLMVSGCSSTIINSDPQGATIYIEGLKVGKTPYEHSDSKISGSSTSIFLVKKGYSDKHINLKKSESLNYYMIIPSLLIYGTLWILDYDGEHTYILDHCCPVNLNEKKRTAMR